MASYITIDGGTTNTRVSLTADHNILESIKLPLGAKDNTNSNAAYKTALKTAVYELLSRFPSEARDITRILASGMITSERGLYEVPHIPAPAGLRELHANIKTVTLPEISDIPFSFIPGIKIESNELSRADMMRGEEAELMGLCDDLHSVCVLLPGSHSKCILTNPEGKITALHTFLTGELLKAVTTATILNGSVTFCDSFDQDALIRGYSFCEQNGLNESLFKVRILEKLFAAKREELFSFLLGAVLHDEIRQVIRLSGDTVLIAGKEQLKHASCVLLSTFSDKKIVPIANESAQNAPSLGMIKIFETGL